MSLSRTERFLKEIMTGKDLILDMIILTHTHQDHTRGIPRVLDSFRIKRLITNHWDLGEKISSRLAIQGVEPEIFWQDDKVRIDSAFSIDFLSPNKEKCEKKLISCNQDDSSLVFKVNFGENSFLFTGDATAIIEKELLKIGADVNASFLKAGHHGYLDASNFEFLNAVSPQYAVITQGGGLVAEETFSKFKRVGAETFSLREDGFVLVRCQYNESECQVESDKNLKNLVNLLQEDIFYEEI